MIILIEGVLLDRIADVGGLLQDCRCCRSVAGLEYEVSLVMAGDVQVPELTV
jgi:hypothetical protein